MYTSYRHSSLARGFTLIELMVALAIGLLMAFGLVRVFASSSDSYRALAQASQQIENGRYAMQVVSQDLMHAGYYGEFAFPAAPAAPLPNPCILGTAAQLKTDLAFYVQGYNNVNAAGGDAPPACISNANVVTGTDILVIRRAGTVVPAALVANEVYIQANADSTNPANPVIAFGADPASYPLLKKATPGGTPPADIRKYHVIIYFVSPCNEPNGGGDVCTGAADDGGRPIPTLKRLTLGLDAGGALAMRTESIAEGIEHLQIDYGIDSMDQLDDVAKRDGLPDGAFVHAPASVAAWGDVMSAQVFVLARTPERSPGWNDTKTYNLGTFNAAYAPADPAFQRKLFVSQVRLVNPAGRREEP